MAEQSGFAITHFKRRRYPRINLNLPVEYTMTIDVEPSLPTRSGAIGEGGLMTYLPMPVSTGTLMKLKIHLPDHVTISCTARVVWTELLTGLEKNDFKTGVEFDQISESDLGILRDFIKVHQIILDNV
jgi:c-di-GMP-binding flagellar brake protein YcgR